MMNKTKAQKERQSTRSEASGQYVKLNPCQSCGKSAGSNFWSDDRCDIAWGQGQILCGRCARKLAKLSDEQYVDYWR